MTRPFLLLTNDDGINAPGLRHLYEVVSEFADVAIVAPVIEKSGAGLSITWRKPLHIDPVAWDAQTPAWMVSGTPADCVKMALAVLLKRKPDMILSGVNKGSNAGKTVLYSGTVGATIEGALKGLPGIAFSFCDMETPPASSTKPYIQQLVRHFLQNPLPKGSVLNVNFPLNCKEGVKGVRFACQGKSYWKESPDKRIHPEGAPYYWLGGAWGPTSEDAESDVHLLDQGYITAVPIQVGDLTCKKSFETLRALNAEDAFSTFS